MNNEFDYVVVGGGSAGCVLAARLSEDPKAKVLLLEAGGRDRHPYIHMPVGFAKLTAGPRTWGFNTVPQKHANDRRIPYAQGRVLGGGSSINAEVFTRGVPADFDRWATDEGATGWSFEEVKPYFLKSEGNTFFAGDWHGVDGPLGVSNIQDPQLMTRAFVQSCIEYGLPYNPDFNGSSQEGCGVYQATILNAKRCSAAVGYLKPALGRPNLKLVTDTRVSRILFEGKRAIGIEYFHGKVHRQAFASAEVIVTSGAVGTPKLLMLSGIGEATHLRSHGIDVLADLPGVGQNLTDHFGIDIVAELKGHTSLDKYNKPWNALAAGLQYTFFKSGPVTSNVVEGGAFWYASEKQAQPDLQFHFLAGAGAEEGVPSVRPGKSGITLNSYTLRPKARGSVRLASSDLDALPLVDPNFLGHEEDLEISVRGVKHSVEIFRQHSLSKYVSEIRFPDRSVKTSEDWANYARQYGRTSYHPTCTCKMGDDDMSVLDSDLKVKGVENLRVCDSSAMPSLIGSNTNATTIMIAEKAADLIRAS